ncbi:MAG: response regulator [candidate division Zixibacteria bacterium]|nr:response regulator [candidate division Zixibacteria bacterium]
MSNPKTGKIQILAVDDESIVLSLICDSLEDESYVIRTAESATDALNMLKDKPADLVITDIRMPEMNGIEMVEHIHKNWPDTGVIFMTGYANLDNAKDAIKHNAIDYIMKPFELTEIRRSVSKAVDKIRKESAYKTSGEKLESLSDFNQMLQTAGDQISVSSASLHFIMMQSGADCGTVLYWDRPKGQFQCITIVDDNVSKRILSDKAIIDALLKCISENFTEPHLIPSPEEHPLHNCISNTKIVNDILPSWFLDKGQAVIVPIKRADSIYGVIMIPPTEISQSIGTANFNLLSMAANQLALSLENLFLLEETQNAYTKLKELQDETISLEKMATRGEMSAEIGHELNNFLGVVAGNLSLLDVLLSKKAYDNIDKHMKAIFSHIERMKRFTSNLMDLSNTASKKEMINFNDLLSEVVDYLKPQKRFKDVVIDFEKVDMNIPLEADATHIQQLLYNIFNNAADATRGCETRQITARVNVDNDGQRFSISIADTGTGIEPERLSQMFNQRFTTKKDGHGYGLMVCKRIVDNHNGHLNVDSIVGQGTIFFIDFPLAATTVEPSVVS